MGTFEPHIPTILTAAVLIPLASFVLILIAGPKLGRNGQGAARVATAAITSSMLLAFLTAGIWFAAHPLPAASSHDATRDHAAHAFPPVLTGHGYTLAHVGETRLTVNYYIDALTILMFCVVTFIAVCIHFYSTAYLQEELGEVTDHDVSLANERPLQRPGRYARFFQALSLFCFSMLGLIISGNLLMTFVFWELVGVCSWFLIGFYTERRAASTAANKAFIVNRIGDFGMLVGMMVLWASLGTFDFGSIDGERGLFAFVRSPENAYALAIPDEMMMAASSDRVEEMVLFTDSNQSPEQRRAEVTSAINRWRLAEGGQPSHGYGLLVLAGLGIFAGCVGKSAQFPLHVWLPDAMEGPTPVSALVHSATMVAAGVFLVARCFPLFLPEVLVVIACVGSITILLGASMAMVATDIKRVLAYSTVSQLGYMMLALGLGGWAAGVLHLVTHAMFKSLLFLCSGSVIHAVHTNEMSLMGGLRRKMPYTATTMLIGCLAISGIGIPSVFGIPLGLSGYYSKDAVLEQVYSFRNENPLWGTLFFVVAAGGALLTAFYMFRLWYLTFAGEPRSPERYAHAHESPRAMVVPLVVLSALAVLIAWPIYGWIGLPTLSGMIEQARPAGASQDLAGQWWQVVLPEESKGHVAAVKAPVGLIAFASAIAGILLASVFYLWKRLDPAEARQSLGPAYRVLSNRWYFDEIYTAVFVRGISAIATGVAVLDRRVLDRLIDGSASLLVRCARIGEVFIDRGSVDGVVNLFAERTYRFGTWLRTFQTGHLRQYVMFVFVSTMFLFLLSQFWSYSAAD